jgi:hypothetical protein
VDVPATRVRSGLKNIAAPPKRTESTQTRAARPIITEMKARQSAKIQKLGQALIDAGLCTLDEQANALGLPRSTAWTILKACHKSSGLSAMIIERMLVSPQLPPCARSIIVEYVEEKSFGLYGGSRRQQQQFAVRLFNYQRKLEGGQAVQADGDVVGTNRIRELERRVRELERLLGHVVTIAPVTGEPELVAYECPNCRHVTSVLVPTRS